MARKRFNGLKRIKIRQSWNKYNLYNLSRATKPSVDLRTFYQQKWTAKSLTRQYHGEQIKEKKWERMFKPHLASVVPMDHAYLARFDGSEQAAGRGSGADFQGKKKVVPKIPYMNMVYAPIERRLDTAIFRALFASSTRQARQFVVHGAVKVNGKKMIHPGYLLNPGDMFQVEVDRVLYATGARKDKYERLDTRRTKRQSEKADLSFLTEGGDPEADEEAEADDGEEASSSTSESAENGTEPNPSQPPKKALSSLLTRARAILQDSKNTLLAKRKQDLRAFQREVRLAMSRSGKQSTAATAVTVTNLDTQFSTLLSKLSPSSSSTSTLSGSATDADSPSLDSSTTTEPISHEDQRDLRLALQKASENPIDPSKPYVTPWRPREYMSAFAFIPRYLEVNQNICAAVYLRHPVARPGLCEVPTPFAPETYQLAFNWYLRRR